MDIIKVVSIGIVGIFLSMTVRSCKPEFGVVTALAVSVFLIFFTAPKLSEVIGGINALSEGTPLDTGYIKAVIKIIALSYITQFASELAKDANEALISKKLELVGKIGIIAIMMPVISGLISAILETLSSI